MNLYNRIPLLALATASLVLAACSTNSLEARLEADPQCRPIVNQKTGAMMPCPGSAKDFALANAKTTQSSLVVLDSASDPTQAPQLKNLPAQPAANSHEASVSPSASVSSTSSSSSALGCTPQVHKKTGGILPCPAP